MGCSTIKPFDKHNCCCGDGHGGISRQLFEKDILEVITQPFEGRINIIDKDHVQIETWVKDTLRANEQWK